MKDSHPAIFVNVLSLSFSLKPYQRNGSEIPGDVVDQYNDFRKKALKTVFVHLSKGYMSANHNEINRKTKGRPSSKRLEVIHMIDYIVSQVCWTEQRIGKMKMHYNRW